MVLPNISMSHQGDGLSTFPLGLTLPAAMEYAKMCDEVFKNLPSKYGLPHVKTLAAKVVALSQFAIDQAFEPALMASRIAAELGDQQARAYALVARSIVNSTPEYADERAEAGKEILRIAQEFSDPALHPIGFYILLLAYLEKGKIRQLDSKLAERVETEPALWFHTLRAILDGDIPASLQLVERQYQLARGRYGSNAESLRSCQMGIIQWMKGEPEGIEEVFLTARKNFPHQILWSASLVWLWHNQGRYAAAESLFASLPPLDDIPRDRYWLATLTVIAQIVTATGTPEFARDVRERLLPFAGHLVPIGEGVAFWGTAARTLGLLEERLGMLPQAREHLELAISLSTKIGAQAWLAEAQIELAEFALRHGIGDIPVTDLLSQALATSQARGFSQLADRAIQRPQIRVLGGFEVIGSNGVKASWTSRKARELLKMLVAARGVATSREVFMDVLWPDQDPVELSNRFSVAVNTIRRALDPQRGRPRQHHVVVESDSVWLNVHHVDIDLERFLRLVRQNDPASKRAAVNLYRGEAFPDEPYSDWAMNIRNHAHYLWQAAVKYLDDD